VALVTLRDGSQITGTATITMNGTQTIKAYDAFGNLAFSIANTMSTNGLGIENAPPPRAWLDQYQRLWWGGESVAVKKLRLLMIGLGMQSDYVRDGIKGKRPFFPV
jgi:hypothetical protein